MNKKTELEKLLEKHGVNTEDLPQRSMNEVLMDAGCGVVYLEDVFPGEEEGTEESE